MKFFNQARIYMNAADEDGSDLGAAPEAPASSAPEDEGAAPTKEQPRIPKARFDSAVNKERARAEAAEARLRELEQSSKVAEDIAALETQIDELEDKYSEAMFAGDKAAGKLVRDQIRKLERKIVTRESVEEASRAQRGLANESEFVAAVREAEGRHSVLDQNSDDYDQEIVDAVGAMAQGLQMRGASPSEALRKAIAVVIDKKPVDKNPRKTEAVRRNTDAARRQPASISRTGADSSAHGDIDVSKMKVSDLKKLSPEKLAQMRGDFL